MKTIKQTYFIQASISDVWMALTEAKQITAWGGGPAKMNDKEGSTFSLWGGDIHGKNIEVIKEKKLKQEWYSGDWNEASIVTFSLHQKDTTTQVDLIHTNIPDGEAKDIEDGWKEYYMNPLTTLCEGNS